MSRLFDFAFTDRKYRIKAYSLSGAIALICALVGRLLLHWDEEDVLLMMAVILCSLAALFILYYVFLRSLSPPEVTAQSRPSLRRTVPILAAIVAGFLSISPHNRIVPKVQASIVDLRLDSLNRPPAVAAFYFKPSERAQAQLRTRFQQLQSIADISYRYQIPVDPNRLIKAQKMIQSSLKPSGLSEETRQSGLIASAKLVDVAALRKAGANTEGPLSYPINSTVEIPNQNIRYLGDHSRISGYGQFLISHSTVVFDGIDFGREKPFGEPFFFLGSDSTVVVRNSTIENIDQPLDGITWINVHFQHSMIKANGGPFALVNVSFNDCDLQWLMLNPFGFDLQERITKANGQPINFVFEGSLKPNEKP